MAPCRWGPALIGAIPYAMPLPLKRGVRSRRSGGTGITGTCGVMRCGCTAQKTNTMVQSACTFAPVGGFTGSLLGLCCSVPVGERLRDAPATGLPAALGKPIHGCEFPTQKNKSQNPRTQTTAQLATERTAPGLSRALPVRACGPSLCDGGAAPGSPLHYRPQSAAKQHAPLAVRSQ